MLVGTSRGSRVLNVGYEGISAELVPGSEVFNAGDTKVLVPEVRGC